MGADGPQAEERAMAAEAHRIARVLCDKFLFFVFLAEALKKIRSVRLWKKGPAKFSNAHFYCGTVSYLEGNIWSIFLSVVQILTKYHLCSKKIKYRLIVLTGTLGTIGTMRTPCQPWRQAALAPTMASGTLTPQPSA
jgi:hypothetical protein